MTDAAWFWEMSLSRKWTGDDDEDDRDDARDVVDTDHHGESMIKMWKGENSLDLHDWINDISLFDLIFLLNNNLGTISNDDVDWVVVVVVVVVIDESSIFLFFSSPLCVVGGLNCLLLFIAYEEKW